MEQKEPQVLRKNLFAKIYGKYIGLSRTHITKYFESDVF